MAGTGAAHGPEHGPILEHTGFRLSWGAVLAGMVVATALHVVLALIGLAIGLEMWEPGDRVDRLGAFATTAVGSVGQIGAAAVGQAGALDIGAVQRELDQALRETGDPALHPDTLSAEAQRVGERATGSASTAEIARDIVETVRERGGSIDREAIANVIAARSGLSRAEAERVAIRVEDLASGVVEQAGVALDTAGEYAVRAADQGTEALATASWWALLTLGLSLAASVGGVVIKARD